MNFELQEFDDSAETPLREKRKALPALTGLRAVAALLVLSFHTGLFLPVGQWPIIRYGWMGVDVFFVLSGFILAHVHTEDFLQISVRNFVRFLSLRLSRIYPVHFATLALVFLFFALSLALGTEHDSGRFDANLLTENLLLVQAWGWNAHDSWNVVAWSISAEWAAYLAFPLLVFGTNKIRTWQLAIACVILALACEIIGMHWLGLADTFTTSQYGLLRISGEFVAGTCAYSLYRNKSLLNLRWDIVSVVTAFVLLSEVALGWSFAALPTITVFILAIAYQQGPIARLLSYGPMIKIGEYSYSLYMVHLITLEIVFYPLSASRFHAYVGIWLVPLYVVGLACVAGLTLITFRYVERPCRTWLRDIIENKFAECTSA